MDGVVGGRRIKRPPPSPSCCAQQYFCRKERCAEERGFLLAPFISAWVSRFSSDACCRRGREGESRQLVQFVSSSLILPPSFIINLVVQFAS